MAIEIRTGVRYDYACNNCGINYQEQRNLGEEQFFTSCQRTGCNGVYELVTQTEFTYEQEIPDPVIQEYNAEEITE